ncbi:MAG: hypothetical protein MHM6MM_001383 [Cercozoa sp. M6MM]
MADGAEETRLLQLSRLLASTERKQRARSLKRVRVWLASSAETSAAYFAQAWKGLFYCMWHSDQVPVQQHLALELAALQHELDAKRRALYFAAFARTMAREWNGIGYYRVDKFMSLVRYVLREQLRALAQVQWAETALTPFEASLRVLLQHSGSAHRGLSLHVADILVQELCGVCHADQQAQSGQSSQGKAGQSKAGQSKASHSSQGKVCIPTLRVFQLVACAALDIVSTDCDAKFSRRLEDGMLRALLQAARERQLGLRKHLGSLSDLLLCYMSRSSTVAASRRRLKKLRQDFEREAQGADRNRNGAAEAAAFEQLDLSLEQLLRLQRQGVRLTQQLHELQTQVAPAQALESANDNVNDNANDSESQSKNESRSQDEDEAEEPPRKKQKLRQEEKKKGVTFSGEKHVRRFRRTQFLQPEIRASQSESTASILKPPKLPIRIDRDALGRQEQRFVTPVREAPTTRKTLSADAAPADSSSGQKKQKPQKKQKKKRGSKRVEQLQNEAAEHGFVLTPDTSSSVDSQQKSEAGMSRRTRSAAKRRRSRRKSSSAK